MYLARSLSYEGVTYSRVEHQLSDLQRDIYDRLAEGWQVVLQNMNAALELTGARDADGTTRNKDAVQAAMAQFWSGQQRFFNQVITAMQMPSVIEQMERDLAEGKALVLQLVNTNEAAQEIRAHWEAVCNEAGLGEAQRNALWGRQFLNPFAMLDYAEA